jgi:hypothetical protein
MSSDAFVSEMEKPNRGCIRVMTHEEKLKPICFVIAPIDDAGTEIRRRSDQIRDYILVPVVGEICGYQVIRADALPEPGLITSQVIQHLIDDPLVIADLTGRNPNVFYELAIRHAVRRPVVQIIQRGERIPFDVAQSRTIEVDHRDLDSVHQCKKDLEDQIHALERDPSLTDNPVSFSIDLQALRKSSNPVEKSNADVIEQLSLLSAQVRNLASRINKAEEMTTLERLDAAKSQIAEMWLDPEKRKSVLSDLEEIKRAYKAAEEEVRSQKNKRDDSEKRGA